MRQISFAPSAIQQDEQRQNTDLDSSLNDLRPPQSRGSQRHPMSTGLSSAFSSGFYTTKPSDVVFYAQEDIYRDSVVGTRELAIKKYCKLKLDLDDARTYESYCFEFCGLLNLRFNEFRFVLASNTKEVPMVRTVKQGCEIFVRSDKKIIPSSQNTMQ